ncbi:MAG: dihydroorotase [Rikenellaceae bacterium]|jgi:dihydroorotase|nr:dihydroorotase [Rikenellaceae bacterium]
MKKRLIENAFLVNEHRAESGWVLIEGERIADLGYGVYRGERPQEVIDAREHLLMPGIIDDQVHFREPGLTHKGDIHSESLAAVAGGVTSFMEMPNTLPQTTTIARWEEKNALGAEHSVANYAFYFGATNDNLDEIRRVDPRRVPGVKLFMGSSTGNMLVDDERSLSAIFAESPVLVATHCEEEAIIRKNLDYYKGLYGEKIDPELHPLIRSAEACYVSTAKAIELATRYGANLHVLHLSTARELELFSDGPLTEKRITAEACVHHLWFNDQDYRRLGNRIKWNPAIKTEDDRQGLLKAIETGRIDIVATDHAPHTAQEKSRPYLQCPSGGPLVQHSLNVMLELYKRGEVTLSHLVEKMCHAPAIRFGVKERGFLRKGYYADLVLVDLSHRWEVTPETIRYKCGWSPFEGEAFTTRVTHTFINGTPVYQNGIVDPTFHGQPLEFLR